MTSSKLLPDVLGVDSGAMTIVLFSQPSCEFCEQVREHYLKPLIASRPRRIVVAEVEINGTRRLQDWTRASLTQAEFARVHNARFAPTLMFFGPHGEVLAAPIVGLSRDFFGGYLDERIGTALRAAA